MTANPIPVIVRPVRPEEFHELGELIVAAYHSLPDARPDQQQRYDERLRDVAGRARVSCVLVAVGPEGEVLGGVTYVRGPDDPFSEELRDGEAGIRMLAVDPAYHGRGVGRALTIACIERARSARRERIVLHTGNWMAAAKHLYESLGFERDPSIDFSPVPGIDVIAYALNLTAYKS
ncbi:MAG: GNAT family N-acetyltransferase [Candidatus Limnocylindrales bacterium]